MIELVIYAVGIVLAFYMAWCLGANDAANPCNCIVGSGVFPMRKAILTFVIFAGIGGVLLGPFVMETVDRGIIPREQFGLAQLALGSFCAVLSACLWVTFSTWKGMPVSTTHAIVGGILGFGFATYPSLIDWGRTNAVFASFITSPFIALLLAAGLFFMLNSYFKKPRPVGVNLGLIASLFLPLFLFAFISVLHRILRWELAEALTWGFVGSLVLLTIFLVSTLKGRNFGNAKLIAYSLILVHFLSAFAFGANDMANATGVFITPTERVAGTPTLQTILMLSVLGAAGIALGGFTWGHRVIDTAAYRVTRLDPLTGLAAEYSQAFTVLFFTTVPAILFGFGIPISTSISNIGTVVGVGLASKGPSGIHKATVGKIVGFWILTIPCVALISMGLFHLFSQVVAI